MAANLGESTPIISKFRSTEQSVEDEIDDIFNEIGIGPWHAFILTINVIAYAVFSTNSLGATLLAFRTDFKCMGNEFTNCSSKMDFEYDSVCLDNPKNKKPTECVPQNNFSNFELTDLSSCPAVAYDPSSSSTVTTDFNLICDNGGKAHLFQALYAIGQIFGTFFAAVASNYCGRVKALVLGSILHAICLCSILATASLGVVLAGRFFLGVATIMVLLPCTTYVIECFPTIWIGWVGLLSFLPFAVWLTFFAVMANFVYKWRTLYVVLAFPSFVIVPLCVLLEESPRWLVKKGRGSDAQRILTKAFRWHHPDEAMDEDLQFRISKLGNSEDSTTQSEEQDRAVKVSPVLQVFNAIKKSIKCCFDIITVPAKFCDLWHSFMGTPFMKRITVVTSICRFFLTAAQTGILFHEQIYKFNPFAYICAAGVAYSLAIPIGLKVSAHVSRRISLIAILVTAGICEFIDLAFYFNLTYVRWIFSISAFFLIVIAQIIFWIYCPELLPMRLKGEGLSLFNFIDHLGFLTGPLIIFFMPEKMWWGICSTLGSLTLITGLLVILLPETKGAALCETVQDVENRQ